MFQPNCQYRLTTVDTEKFTNFAGDGQTYCYALTADRLDEPLRTKVTILSEDGIRHPAFFKGMVYITFAAVINPPVWVGSLGVGALEAPPATNTEVGFDVSHYYRQEMATLELLLDNRTLREMQASLPWTAHYHRDFRSTPMTHKDFGHALLHVTKATGKLATILDQAEHRGFDWSDPANRTEVSKYIADLVICALRMANTCPDGVIDLQQAVQSRISTKNNQLAAAKKQGVGDA